MYKNGPIVLFVANDCSSASALSLTFEPDSLLVGELEKFEISFKIEARKIILPQAYT